VVFAHYVVLSNVLQAERSLLPSPRRGHVIRCSEGPYVRLSGWMWPRDIFCSRSSPTADAARSPSSKSLNLDEHPGMVSGRNVTSHRFFWEQ